MELQKLPFLPLHFFYHLFSPVNRKWFLAMGVMTFLVLVCLFGSYVFPDFFPLDIIEVAETTSENVPVYQVERSYRTFDVSLQAYRQWVSFSAGPIHPHIFPLAFFWIVQWIAWAFFLATASTIQSRWAFAFYFVFALFIFFTDIPALFFSGGGILYRSMGFLMSIFPLVLAYFFQVNTIKLSLSGRFLSFLLILGLYLFFPLKLEGEMGMHQLSVNAFPYLVCLSLFVILLSAKDPTNLIVAVSTNRPDKKSRLGFRWIILLLLAFFVIEFFWLYEFLNFNWLGELTLGFRPTHLLIITLLFTVFTSQNHYHQFKEVISSQASYTFLIQCAVLVTASFVFLNFSSGDTFFVYTIERLLAIVFLATGLAHAVFIIYNHFHLLKQKVNLFYLMTNGPKFGFWVVLLCGTLGIIFAEGYDNWKSIDLFQHSYYNHIGDQNIMRGDQDKAMSAYNLARAKSLNSTKSNYNLASLLLTDPRRTPDAVRYYLQATRLYEFPPARLNAANLYQLNNQPDAAKSVLEAGLDPGNINPYLANNLAMIYEREQLADSAIIWLKEALQSDPSLASVYSNLALIYSDNDLPEEAETFLGFALEESPEVDAESQQVARVNALYYQLKNRKMNIWEDGGLPPGQQFFLAYNHQLSKLTHDWRDLNKGLIKQLLINSQMQSPEVMLIDGLQMFYEDSILHAVSRLEYLAESYQAYAQKANYLLGVSFYEKGVPEMARKYFLASGDAGNPWGYLHSAQMEIELGMPDTANSHLSLIRVAYDTLWEEASKEQAMLLLPYVKDEVYALKMFDLNTLSFNENIRMGLYADSLNQYITALSSFRKAQQQDSTNIAPYLELARIYNKYRDTLAIENLKAGLSLVDSGNIALKTELARAYLYQGMISRSSALIEEIKNRVNSTPELLRLEAEKALMEMDTLQSIVLWDSLHRQYPMDLQTILELCRIFEATQSYELGNAVIAEALEYNTENAELWYFYAIFSRAWNLSKDAGNGALKAIELAYDPRRKQQIRQEFAQEIQLVTTN